MATRIQSDIKKITEAAKDNLYYLNTDQDDIDSWQNYPVVIALSETAGLTIDEVQNPENRNVDVSLTILAQYPDRTTEDTDVSYEEKLIALYEEYVKIIEVIVTKYLTGTSYKFCWTIESDISFERLRDETIHELQGANAVFTLSKRYVQDTCCVDFDESKLK